MGNLILEFNNSQNWDFVYQTSQQAVSINNQSQPIPEITIPFLLDRRIVAVHASSLTAKSTWRFAGFLNQKVQIGLLIGGQPDARMPRNKIWLNNINLIVYPQYSSTYSLSVEPPFWLRDISLSVYKYVGVESDSTDNLILSIQNQLNTIESKIDGL